MCAGRDALSAQEMKLDKTIYRRTPAGLAALRGSDMAVPVDHRRILAILEGDTDIDVVRGFLRQFPDALIDDWLAELIEIGFIEMADSDDAQNLSLEELVNSGLVFRILGEPYDERLRLDDEVMEAGIVLRRKSAYLSTRRQQNREPLSKTAAQCVVLLVEDDPDQAALADLRISTAGYGVRIARSRQEMFEDLDSAPLPDVVLLDVMLPDGNGFDILAGMRRHPGFSSIPVILLTALTSAEDIQRGLALGADGYITKPYSENLLADTMRQVLRHA